MIQPSRSFAADRLAVAVYPNRALLGRAAALAAAEILRAVLQQKAGARVVFACAPSQDEFLTSLTQLPDIPWERVTAFHMDEYVGLSAHHSASFRHYLQRHLTSRVRLARVNEIAGEAPEVAGECARYGDLLRAKPIDLVCLGIGENGHLAFNDPPVADFHDPLPVKCVELDHACRSQQVNDGCFPNLERVPRRALTLTIPTLLSATHMVCVVPGPRKAAAVKAALGQPIAPSCPASVLRTHPAATLFLDRESAAGLAQAGVFP